MKKLVIMRGLPGSGKSTKAKTLNGLVLSTDDYNGLYSHKDGKVVFHGGEKKDGLPLIVVAHNWNQSRAKEAMGNGVELVIIDNTNIQKWEMRTYVQYAQQFGYKVELMQSDAPHAFDVNVCAVKNAHGVSKEVIQAMKNRWEGDCTIEDILASKAPWES